MRRRFQLTRASCYHGLRVSNPFLIFSFIFGLAVCAGFGARLLRQPAFLGHVLVGLLVGYWGLVRGGEISKILEVLSSAGVMLLLFLVGLEMDIGQIKKMGDKALALSFGQIVLTSLVFSGMFLGLSFSFSSSVFLAVVVAFSSTIMVIKLLSEKHDLESLTGKTAVTLLLIQDLSAIVILVVLGGRGGSNAIFLILKVALLMGLTVLMSRKVMPRLLHRMSKSVDELILFSLAWCFVLSAVIASPVFGLSLEIGGFLAGLALSGSFEHSHIAVKIKPIRDFFLTIFFVGLGLSLRLNFGLWLTAILISGLVIVVKPVIVWALMRGLGYKQRVAFYTGILFGQISEFSFILVGVGAKAGLIDYSAVSLISLVGLITMVISGYLIIDNEMVYRLFRPVLSRIWKDKPGETETEVALTDHIVLFGCHRMGRSILSHLANIKKKVLIVDFDPEVVERMKDDGWRVIYADISDIESYDRFDLPGAKMVISTVKDLKDNLLMLAEIKRRHLGLSVVVDAESAEDAESLYKSGATYVIFPHFVGGLHLSDLVKKGVSEKTDFERYRKYQRDLMKGVYV